MYTLNKFYFKPKKYHKNSGFSLMEMVITTIMVGVITAATLPSIVGLFNSNRVNESLADIEGAIKESQRLAIKRKKACQIKFVTIKDDDNDDRVAVQVFDDSNNGCLLSQRILDKNITFSTNIADTPPNISFSGKGNTVGLNLDPDTGDNAILVVSHPDTDKKKCVLVAPGLGIVKTGDYEENDLSSISDEYCETN